MYQVKTSNRIAALRLGWWWHWRCWWWWG